MPPRVLDLGENTLSPSAHCLEVHNHSLPGFQSQVSASRLNLLAQTPYNPLFVPDSDFPMLLIPAFQIVTG